MTEQKAYITLIKKKVKSGKHQGQYHMVPIPGAVQKAVYKTGRHIRSIYSGIAIHKKKRGIQGYHESKSDLPKKKTVRMTTGAGALEKHLARKHARRIKKGSQQASQQARQSSQSSQSSQSAKSSPYQPSQTSSGMQKLAGFAFTRKK